MSTKLPSLDQSESLVVLALAGLAAYIIYEMYTAGKTVKDQVTKTAQTIIDAGKAVLAAPGNAADTIQGRDNTPDQSAAETRRLMAQNGGQIPEGSAPSWMFAPNLGLDNGSVTSGNTITAADASPSPTAIDGLSGNW